MHQEAVAVEARIEQWSNQVGNLCGSIGSAFEDGEWPNQVGNLCGSIGAAFEDGDMVGNLSRSIGDALDDGAE